MAVLPVYARKQVVAHVQVDDIDYLWAKDYRWHLSEGYAARGQRRGKDRKPFRMFLHREVLGLKHGSRDLVVDHINGEKLDNRRDNLRAVSHSDNAHNRRGQNPGRRTSQYRGVSWFTARNCWRVAVMVNGTRTVVGYFDDEYQAAVAAHTFYAEHAPLANVTAPIGPGTEASNPAKHSLTGARAEAAISNPPDS